MLLLIARLNSKAVHAKRQNRRLVEVGIIDSRAKNTPSCANSVVEQLEPSTGCCFLLKPARQA